MKRKTSAGRQIRSFLTVILSSVLLGGLLAFFFVYYYSPTGQYTARNILLSPQLLLQMKYSDLNPRTGGQSKFVFEKAEFFYLDANSKERRQISIANEKYNQFYDLISGDRSLLEIDQRVIQLFEQEIPSKLVLTVRTESSAEWQFANKVFQEMEIVGDFYRVELREYQAKTPWAYFHHTGIYDTSLRIFVP